MTLGNGASSLSSSLQTFNQLSLKAMLSEMHSPSSAKNYKNLHIGVWIIKHNKLPAAYSWFTKF